MGILFALEWCTVQDTSACRMQRCCGLWGTAVVIWDFWMWSPSIFPGTLVQLQVQFTWQGIFTGFNAIVDVTLISKSRTQTNKPRTVCGVARCCCNLLGLGNVGWSSSKTHKTKQLSNYLLCSDYGTSHISNYVRFR